MVIDRVKRVVELRADLLIPGYYSNSKRKGQVPCEVSYCPRSKYADLGGKVASNMQFNMDEAY